MLRQRPPEEDNVEGHHQAHARHQGFPPISIELVGSKHQHPKDGLHGPLGLWRPDRTSGVFDFAWFTLSGVRTHEKRPL